MHAFPECSDVGKLFKKHAQPIYDFPVICDIEFCYITAQIHAQILRHRFTPSQTVLSQAHYLKTTPDLFTIPQRFVT